MTTSIDNLDWAKGQGLLPAIVQDADDLRVLMLAYMNQDSIAKTQETGKVTFFSRSRQSLWTKGETSGNTLELVSLHADCDHDTILVRARPAGPVCHRGTPTCFDGVPDGAVGFIGRLNSIVEARSAAPSDSSYTSKLLSSGTKRVAQKVGEEGVEAALAAAVGDRAELKNEAADLLYHLLVLLRSADVPLTDVVAELENRHDQSR